MSDNLGVISLMCQELSLALRSNKTQKETESEKTGGGVLTPTARNQEFFAKENGGKSGGGGGGGGASGITCNGAAVDADTQSQKGEVQVQMKEAEDTGDDNEAGAGAVTVSEAISTVSGARGISTVSVLTPPQEVSVQPTHSAGVAYVPAFITTSSSVWLRLQWVWVRKDQQHVSLPKQIASNQVTACGVFVLVLTITRPSTAPI